MQVLHFLAAPVPKPDVETVSVSATFIAFLIFLGLGLWFVALSHKSKSKGGSIVWGLLSLLSLGAAASTLTNYAFGRRMVEGARKLSADPDFDITIQGHQLTPAQLLLLFCIIAGVAFLVVSNFKARVIIGILFGVLFVAMVASSELASVMLSLFIDLIEKCISLVKAFARSFGS